MIYEMVTHPAYTFALRDLEMQHLTHFQRWIDEKIGLEHRQYKNQKLQEFYDQSDADPTNAEIIEEDDGSIIVEQECICGITRNKDIPFFLFFVFLSIGFCKDPLSVFLHNMFCVVSLYRVFVILSPFHFCPKVDSPESQVFSACSNRRRLS